MPSYVGFDVSLAETSVCVLDSAGRVRFEGEVKSRTDDPSPAYDSMPLILRLALAHVAALDAKAREIAAYNLVRIPKLLAA